MGLTPRRHVLLAEDNRTCQIAAQLLIKKLGHAADLAQNGEEAVAAAARHPYDLILMDCQMPRMDGYAATREIRRAQDGRAHTPIVAMTAETSAEESAKGLAAGMDGWISKPVTLDKLSAVFTRYTAVDPETMLQLRAQLNDETILREAIDQYLSDAPAHLRALRDAVARKNMTGITNEAHALRGSSGLFNASRVMLLCRQLENLEVPQTPAETGALLDILEKELAAACDALSAENHRTA